MFVNILRIATYFLSLSPTPFKINKNVQNCLNDNKEIKPESPKVYAYKIIIIF